MKLRYLPATVFAPLLFVACSAAPDDSPAAASEAAAFTTSNRLVDYLRVRAPVGYAMRHWHRDRNDRRAQGWNPPSYSTQVYSVGTYAGHSAFLRDQVGGLVPGGRYNETFMWDDFPSPDSPTILYLARASLTGEVDPSRSSAATCSASNLGGCDAASIGGQEWAWNENPTPAQGTDASPALRGWDSSTKGPNQGSWWFQGGILRVHTQDQYCGQSWYRSTWTEAHLRAYADAANTAPGFDGWTDPGTSAQSTTLRPASAYVVRQYSGCAADCAEPWNTCSVFEDHVYAKNAVGAAMGEILVVVGVTPAVLGTGNYGVTDVMMPYN